MTPEQCIDMIEVRDALVKAGCINPGKAMRCMASLTRLWEEWHVCVTEDGEAFIGDKREGAYFIHPQYGIKYIHDGEYESHDVIIITSDDGWLRLK